MGVNFLLGNINIQSSKVSENIPNASTCDVQWHSNDACIMWSKIRGGQVESNAFAKLRFVLDVLKQHPGMVRGL